MASEWVSIAEAAERYGVSADTIRRRLKRGELAGRKEATAQGFTWAIEVPSDPGNGERKTSENAQHTAKQQPAAASAEDALELVRLRERVAGLERERGELIAQRDAWQDQARRSSEAEAQLRELVARAQMLAQALPATAGAHAPAEPTESPRTHESAAHGSQDAPAWWRRILPRKGA